MSFKRNDIVNKQRLRDALEEDTSMGFAHNDIVTTYAMDKAIAEGGGGGGAQTFTVTLSYAEGASHKYFYGTVAYEEGVGNIVESLIKIDGNFFDITNSAIDAGAYELLPAYDGAAGYFGCNGEDGATVTGDATIWYDNFSESYYVKMTGDCTVTILS